MSNAFRRSFGMMLVKLSSARSAGSSQLVTGASCPTLSGMKDRKRLISARQASSSSAPLSTVPFFVCTFHPPSSSLVFCSPMARATTAGPAVSICAVFLDITEKCEATSRPAGKPATAPRAAVATGTVDIA